jgi:hypothetical protein
MLAKRRAAISPRFRQMEAVMRKLDDFENLPSFQHLA